VNPITGSSLRQRLNPSAAEGGGSYALRQPFAQRNFICPVGLSPSPRAYRLAYACQREPAHDRALRRAFRLRGKLEAEGGIGEHVPKPKWMRWRTYDRKLEEIFAAEEVVDAHMEVLVRKVDRCLGRPPRVPLITKT
jgi:hypothetical protein